MKIYEMLPSNIVSVNTLKRTECCHEQTVVNFSDGAAHAAVVFQSLLLFGSYRKICQVLFIPNEGNDMFTLWMTPRVVEFSEGRRACSGVRSRGCGAS